MNCRGNLPDATRMKEVGGKQSALAHRRSAAPHLQLELST